MRLAGAKNLQEASPDIAEVTSVLRRRERLAAAKGGGTRASSAANRAKHIDLLRCSQCMQQNPGHGVIFRCGLGETDGIEVMGFSRGRSSLPTVFHTTAVASVNMLVDRPALAVGRAR